MTVDDLLISNTDEVSGGQSVKFGLRICDLAKTLQDLIQSFHPLWTSRSVPVKSKLC